MERTLFQTSRFVAGLSTEQAETEAGDIYANDQMNLRTDAQGHLKVRNATRAIGSLTNETPDGVTITGVVASPEGFVFYLRSDGLLYVKDVNKAGEQYIIHVPGEAGEMRGRLSLISEFKDFHIITSEGEDRGYWLDIRNRDNVYARNLGINVPTHRPTLQRIALADGFVGLQRGFKYFYRYTYVRFFQGDLIPGTRFVYEPQLDKDGKYLFAGMESNPSNPIPIILLGNSPVPEATGDDALSVWRRLLNFAFPLVSSAINTALGDPYNAFILSNFQHSSDPQVTGINVYRSNAVKLADTAEDVTEYRQVAYLSKERVAGDGEGGHWFVDTVSNLPGTGTTPVDAEGVATGEPTLTNRWSEQKLLRTDNNHLTRAKSFFFFNDLIFAPQGNELRYSDLRDGIPTLWAFPEANSIRRPSRIDFAAAYNETLLFGGEDGLWRLTGGTEETFDIDRIAGIGALDGYSWSPLKQGIGFISRKGFYITDTIQVERISKPLDKAFEELNIKTGSVGFLPDERIIFGLQLLDPLSIKDNVTHRTFIFESVGRWERWSTRIKQICRYEADGTTQVEIAVDEARLRRLIWDTPEITQDTEIVALDAPRHPISWQWTSQVLAGDAHGLGEEPKRFKWLTISGKAENPVTIVFLIKDENENIIRIVETIDINRSTFHPARVRINRRGISCQFVLAGSDEVTLRGLKLVADTR